MQEIKSAVGLLIVRNEQKRSEYKNEINGKLNEIIKNRDINERSNEI